MGLRWLERSQLSGRGRLLLPAVLLAKTLDAARGIDQLRLAGIERMANSADVGTDAGDRGTCLERITTRTANLRCGVQWMNAWFHWVASGKTSL